MDLREITDFNAPELDVYARLTENQLVNRADPANALFVAESPLVIGRALDAGCTPVSFLMETKHVNGKGAEILARCPADIPVYAAELEVLTQLTGFHLTRGMLCAMRRPPLPTVEEICAKSRRIAVLENVMNPTNIGAIFRSAAALGMDAVLLTAASTAIAGPISFIALVAPHIARRLSGTARWGLTQAALCGSLLLLAADLCAQRLFMPYQLPVGVVTVSLGGIYLIVLLVQESRKK